MYVVTNRNLQPNERPDKRFGPSFNQLGPNELRLAEANKIDGNWQVDILADRMVYDGQEMWASEAAFLTAQQRMHKSDTHCVFFVHGFNTDFDNALESAYKIQQSYGVEVVLFTWPSNGGGMSGVASYRADKRDAMLSLNALDRCFEKLDSYFQKYAEQCHQKFSFVAHSMGNYLFKYLVKSSVYQGETLLFDNILMLAADVNNHDHAEWVEKIQYRNRLFIAINEDDTALLASRAKSGEQQKARLGHWMRNLTAKNAIYIDFTDAQFVHTHHNYFTDEGALRNARIKDFFRVAFNGGKAERGLIFDPATGAHKFP